MVRGPFRLVALLTGMTTLMPITGGQARAEEAPLFDAGKLLGTGGVSQVEGQGGGGIVPWALITGYGTRDSAGANAHYSFVGLPDFQLHGFGVAAGARDRVELSYDRSVLDTRGTGQALGLGRNYTIRLDTLGFKLRLFGDVVYDQDTWLPQVSAGVQLKANNRGSLLRAIGARGDEGADAYLAATKLLLSESVLVDATVRMTKANQLGLLGFGGDRQNSYRPQFEGSIAYLPTRQLAFGAEYRTKPDNLRFAHESNWMDVFCAYFFDKHVSAVIGFVGLGSIATRKNQEGVYASLQMGF